MEYERINKVQTGIISPSKLRLKLIGSPNKRKDGLKSNSISARTSPAKLHDAEFIKNSLLADDYGVDSVDEGSSNSKDSEGASSLQNTAPSIETSTPSSGSSVKLSSESRGKNHQFSRVSGGNNLSTVHPVRTPEEDSEGASSLQNTAPSIETSTPSSGSSVKLSAESRGKNHQFSRVSGGNNLSTVHPVRTPEEDNNLDYDSNASSSSFEFHNGQRSHQNHVSRTFSRPVPCKWNDAEKWIMNRQNGQPKHSKKNNLQSQANWQYRTAGPESANSTTKMILGLDKFSFPHPGIAPSSKANGSVDLHLHPQSKDLKEVEPNVSSSIEKHAVNPPFATIRSVSMRDMGTEMTPVPSQEPSRTGTPVGATTPLRSPTSSMPSTPGRGEPTSTPVEAMSDDESNPRKQSTHKNLSERELHLKTRKEIVALGVQLGKMNIAAWASKEEKEKSASSKEQIEREELERIEFENRAAAWVEAEKSKHAARYRREDIKIQAWESHCKAKLEEELRRTEAQAEKIRANAEEKMKKKIATTKQQSEEKLAAAEALRNRQAAKASAQAEYIRQTGRIPPSRFRCCSWLS